jgi:hypothetical protein
LIVDRVSNHLETSGAATRIPALPPANFPLKFAQTHCRQQISAVSSSFVLAGSAFFMDASRFPLSPAFPCCLQPISAAGSARLVGASSFPADSSILALSPAFLSRLEAGGAAGRDAGAP